MYNMPSQLSNYRFNTIHQKGPVSITWFKLKDLDGEVEGDCLTHDELQQLADYFANNKENFNYSNHASCIEGDGPICSSLFPIEEIHPTNVILKTKPIVERGSNIYKCMEIELLNCNGTLNHTYNLPFEIIGRIEN